MTTRHIFLLEISKKSSLEVVLGPQDNYYDCMTNIDCVLGFILLIHLDIFAWT